MAGKGNPKTGGRRRGVANKTTALLKDAVLQAAEAAGDKGGMVGFLTTQAKQNPTAFMSLLGRVIPLQNAANKDDDIKIEVKFVPSRPGL